NDDMPFLVDSVTAAINERGRVVRLVIHPIVNSHRDGAGQVEGLGGSGEGLRESWMQIEITRQPDAAERQALADAIAIVLGDVRAAVTDWRKMRHALVEVAAVLDAGIVTLPAEEVGEGAAFLRWLDGDNFILLGVRDYDFAGGNEAPPLG